MPTTEERVKLAGHRIKQKFFDYQIRDIEEYTNKHTERYYRAAAKLKQISSYYKVSALDFDTVLVGNVFVPRYRWCGLNIQFTEADKAILVDCKSTTIDLLISQIRLMNGVIWTTGDDCDWENTSETEFLEAVSLATWIEFNPSKCYYSTAEKEKTGFSLGKDEPTIHDDMESWECEFLLYANFDQDEEEETGCPLDCITYTASYATPFKPNIN